MYEWYDIDTGEVFYVGKGTGRRKGVISNRNRYFKRYYEKHNCSVRLVEDEIENEEYAYELEAELICLYKSNGECFANITDGWENPPVYFGEQNGMYGKHHTEETKKKISEEIIKNKSCSGKKNSQYGISPKERMNEETYNRWIEKHKEQMSGENNNQYGISPYERIPADKIEDWKKNISNSCRDERNGNAKKIKMYKGTFLLEFLMVKRCAQYICDNGISKGNLISVCSSITKALITKKTYLGFYFDYIK